MTHHFRGYPVPEGATHMVQYPAGAIYFIDANNGKISEAINDGRPPRLADWLPLGAVVRPHRVLEYSERVVGEGGSMWPIPPRRILGYDVPEGATHWRAEGFFDCPMFFRANGNDEPYQIWEAGSPQTSWRTSMAFRTWGEKLRACTDNPDRPIHHLSDPIPDELEVKEYTTEDLI